MSPANVMAGVDFGRYKRIMQFIWDPPPKNDDPSLAPIWCLGKRYAADAQTDTPSLSVQSNTTGGAAQELDRENVIIAADHLDKVRLQSGDANGGVLTTNANEEEQGWPSEFLDDFESRFWFTYRSHFPPIRKSEDPSASSAMTLAVRLRSQLVDQGGFTSDTGWGCMIRSGQCLIANAMGLLDFGRGWKRGTRPGDERHLLAQFADDPKSPYSIHKFVEHGAAACGTYPGQWFGPSATASCIKALTQQHTPSRIRVYVTGDGADVYEDAIFRLAHEGGNGFIPVLILVGTRLGIKGVTPVYWDALKETLKLQQCVGIAGGSPSSSYYFVGVQGDQFFYLDPHHTRTALPRYDNVEDYSIDEIDSCHTRRLRRLHIRDMDPSMLIAFLIQTEADWYSWRDALEKFPAKPVIRISSVEPMAHAAVERESAVDDVSTFDDEEDGNPDGELIDLPS